METPVTRWFLFSIGGAACLSGALALGMFAGPTSAESAPAPELPVAGLEPSFAEEFDGASVDPRRWLFAYYNPKTDRPTAAKRSLPGNHERQLYMDKGYLGLGVDPFRVANGILTIEARPFSPTELAKVRADIAREPADIRDGPLRNVAYSSGVITTRGRFAQRYGYFEMRARWTGGKGLWPAFWLLPASGKWPPEIDILEAHGDKPRTAFHALHSTKQPSMGRTTTTGAAQSEFHRYGVLWTPTRIDYYVDGIKSQSIPATADLTEPMYMIVNLAVGGGWPGYPDASTKFPAAMDVDYVRAWRFTAQPQ
jgi:beta-glucanase (GH16 family)